MSLTKTKAKALTNLLTIAFALFCMTVLFKVNAHASTFTMTDVSIYDGSNITDTEVYSSESIANGQTVDVTGISNTTSFPRTFKIKYNTIAENVSAIITAKLDNTNADAEKWSSNTNYSQENSCYYADIIVQAAGTWEFTFTISETVSGTFKLTIPADTEAPTIVTYKALLDSSTVLIDAHVSDAASKVAEVKLVDKVTYDAATGETSKEKYEYINSSNSGKLVSANNENEFSVTTEEGGTIKKVYAGISEFKVTKNGNYYVFAKDFSGNVGAKLVEVNEIPTTQGGITIGSIKYEDIVSGSVVTGQKVTIPITTKLSNYGLVSIDVYRVAISKFNQNSFSNSDYDYKVEYRDKLANLVTYHSPNNKIYTKTCGDFILSSSRKIDYDSSSLVDNANGKYTLVYNFDRNENYYFIATDAYGNQIIRNINVEHVGDRYNRPSSDSSSSSGDDSGSSTTTTITETKEPAPITVTYTVKKGDTLSKIARKNGLTLNELIALNPQIKNPNLIYIGQAITVSKTSATTNAATTNTTANKTYTIVKGDTLFKIARRNGLTLAELKSLNASLFAQKYIFAGQTVLLK